MRAHIRISALAVVVLCGAAHARECAAQRVGSVAAGVSPSAVGPAAPTAVPLGGLRTVPLTSATPSVGTRRPVTRRAHYPVRVLDAPYARSVGVTPANSNPSQASSGSVRWSWMPTAERPRWVVDTTQAPVQAWRDLIVTDVVCNSAGTCIDRQQRLRARWIARCDCYAFADGWNRIWRVE